MVQKNAEASVIQEWQETEVCQWLTEVFLAPKDPKMGKALQDIQPLLGCPVGSEDQWLVYKWVI